MGNTKTKTQLSDASNSTEQKMATMTHNEWVSQIKQQQQKYLHKVTAAMKEEELSDYDLFIDYLIFTRSITGYSEISIIARMVRYYVGAVHAVSMFNEEAFTFHGLRISIAIHPITAQIYIADECQIYHVDEQRGSNSDHGVSFTVIAKIASAKQSKFKVTDLTFSSDGTRLFCLLNSNVRDVYQVLLDSALSLDRRIVSKSPCHCMDYLLFDFNHFYFDSEFLSKLLLFEDVTKSRPETQHTANYGHWIHLKLYTTSTLYTLDSYRKNLWIACNAEQSAILPVQKPLLIRIPFVFVTLTRELQILQQQSKLVTDAAMHDIENDEYEQKVKEIQQEIDALKAERMKSENRCEVINLSKLLSAELHAVNTVGHVTAFDVDKLHGGVYLIMSDHRFYRIESVKRRKMSMVTEHGNSHDEKRGNRQLAAKEVVQTTSDWSVTHHASLRDILPDGVPLGICNVRYDSITGRIIVADNYKLQALYI